TDLKGKKVVLAMIFANCTYACPLIVNDMKIVEKSLGTREKEETRFVLVSIDPERDTPKALAEYAKTRELDQSRWKLLTGRHEEIKELAALLGFKYKKGEKGDYIHSNLINVFNRQGELVFQHEGLNKGTEDIVEKVKILN
ncbi:MAG: SCO family protein, partial [Bacillota bacterium]